VPVLSFHDLLPDFTVQALGTIRLSGGATSAVGDAETRAGWPRQAVA
jgi:hypothetical protein